MKRREAIAGAGSLAVLGVAGYLVFGQESPVSGERLDPVTIDTLSAPGSPGEPVPVPYDDAITVIDLFATTCTACPAHLETLQAVRQRLGTTVRFVSVTNERVGEAQPRSFFRDWWNQHGGEWPVGFDAEGQLTKALGLPSYPFTAIVDRSGRVRWSKSGTPGEDTIVSEIDAVAMG